MNSGVRGWNRVASERDRPFYTHITMTERFKQAVSRASKLPSEQQDAIAALILEEIEDEARWDETFAKSPDLLERLAAEADAEEKRGATEELDPDSL